MLVAMLAKTLLDPGCNFPEVTPKDVLALLRWTMTSVDTYFRAVNKKGRRWIPAPEACALCEHCHNICEPRSLYHA
jgi:hypothetical protein